MGRCCYSCLKFFVTIFNFFYMCLGLALLGSVLWLLLDESVPYATTFKAEGYEYRLYFLMALAGVMTIMGFLGCCGAAQESQCMLATFFTLVLMLCVLQIGGGVWAYFNQHLFQPTLEEAISVSLKDHYGKLPHSTISLDVLQRELKCCGSTGPSNWAGSHYNNDEGSAIEIGVIKNNLVYKVPKSCCVRGISDEQCETAQQQNFASPIIDLVKQPNIYTDGCGAKMLGLIRSHDYVILAVLLAILLAEILAMIFSIVLCCAVRRSDDLKA